MTDDPRLLAEWFETDRWMGSSAFLLPMEPQGLYRAMLTQAWRRGARLPVDHVEIRRATGCTEAEWKRCWPRISRYWIERDGVLINETQVKIYGESLRKAQAASARGKLGAAAKLTRSKHKRNNPSTAQVGAQAPAQAEPEQEPKQCSSERWSGAQALPEYKPLSVSDGFPAHTDARVLSLDPPHGDIQSSGNGDILPSSVDVAVDEGDRGSKELQEARAQDVDEDQPLEGDVLDEPKAPAKVKPTKAECAAIDEAAVILGVTVTYSQANAKAVTRAARHYEPDQIQRVLRAVREGVTDMGRWCHERLDSIKLAYVLRPGEKGAADSILEQLDRLEEQRKTGAIVVRTPSPPPPPTARQQREHNALSLAMRAGLKGDGTV